MQGPPGDGNASAAGTSTSGTDVLLQLLASLQQQQQQQHPQQQHVEVHQQQVQPAVPPTLPQSSFVVPQRPQSLQQPQQEQPQQEEQQGAASLLQALLLGLQHSQGGAVQQQQQVPVQPPPDPLSALMPSLRQQQPADDASFLLTLLQLLAAASGGSSQVVTQQAQVALPPRTTAALVSAVPSAFPQTLPWSPYTAPPQQNDVMRWLSQFSALPGSGGTASAGHHMAAMHAPGTSPVEGGGMHAGPSQYRGAPPPSVLIPPEAKRRRSGEDLVYGHSGSGAGMQHAPAYAEHLPQAAGQLPAQLGQQLAAALAADAALAVDRAQGLSGAGQQQPHGGQLPLELLLAAGGGPAGADPGMGDDGSGSHEFQAALAAAMAAVGMPAAPGSGSSHHPAAAYGSSAAAHHVGGGSSRHANPHGYGVAMPAPEGMRRADMVALYGHPTEQVERQITNQTYILRLHVTTQMAQLLFPPRAELEAAHQAATALDPPPPSSSRLGGGSTYIQLFKQRLTVVDEGNRAWPVQYEGFLSSGQRHYRLTSGWVGLMRAQQVGIGDTLVLERWTDDRWIIHLSIRRKDQQEQQADDSSAAAAAATLAGGAPDAAPAALGMGAPPPMLLRSQPMFTVSVPQPSFPEGPSRHAAAADARGLEAVAIKQEPETGDTMAPGLVPSPSPPVPSGAAAGADALPSAPAQAADAEPSAPEVPAAAASPTTLGGEGGSTAEAAQ